MSDTVASSSACSVVEVATWIRTTYTTLREATVGYATGEPYLILEVGVFVQKQLVGQQLLPHTAYVV